MASPTVPKSAPRPGEFISGKYRVNHALGAGGMGYVLAVTRLADNAPLAIKMLNPDLAADPHIVARFLHEARAAMSVTSEHVARVHDVGELPTGTPYLVMERLKGVDLATKLERDGIVPYTEAVDWILEACEALAEAHAQRYVHRDLKPSNLFLAEIDGRLVIKVLDFGIAKSLDREQQHKLTTTSAVLGSPSYMSPEQLKSSKHVDERSDIWSLGVVLYELISGAPPFDAPTLPELSVLILTSRPAPLAARESSVPKALSDVIAACLRRDPTQRFGNLAELAKYLAPYATSLGQESAARVIAVLGLPPSSVVIGTEEELATTVQDTTGSSLRPPLPSEHGAAVTMPEKADTHAGAKRQKLGQMIGGTLAVLVAGAFLGIYALQHKQVAANATSGIDSGMTATVSTQATLPTLATQSIATTTSATTESAAPDPAALAIDAGTTSALAITADAGGALPKPGPALSTSSTGGSSSRPARPAASGSAPKKPPKDLWGTEH